MEQLKDGMAKQPNVGNSMMPSEQTLSELVRRIVESVRPLRIILFGSAQTVYRNLMNLGVPKDVVVVTESDIREYADNPSLVLFPALRQGRELYHAKG